MASLKEIKKQIENANALGRINLAKKGVEVSSTATTYEIMQGIANVENDRESLNIAYGETAPEDTSKLWVKANTPSYVKVSSDIEWVEKIATTTEKLTTAINTMGCASVGDKIYLFGGYSDQDLNTIQVFDTQAQKNIIMPETLPIASHAMCCSSVGTKIYIFGGRYGSGIALDTINIFDTETNTISTLSTKLPKATAFGCCASVGTKIYLFGGDNSTQIRMFDTQNNSISTISAVMPESIHSMNCISVGDKIYIFGGRNYSNVYQNKIHVFDTKTSTVSTLLTTLPTTCELMSCADFNGKIYLFGGRNSGSSYFNTIHVFDINTYAIKTLETALPNVCSNMSCARDGLNIYLIGGKNESKGFDTINCLSLTYDLTQGNMAIQRGLLKNKFNLINTNTAQIQIGVENVFIGNENNHAELCEAYLHNGMEWQQI